MRRALSLFGVALWLCGCSSDSPGSKDVGLTDQPPSGDVPLATDGVAKDQPQGSDRAIADLILGEGGIVDQAKPGDQSLKEIGSTVDGPKSCGKIRCDCYAFSTKQNKWLPLFGKSNQVTVFPDFKVRVVNMLGALKVKQATMMPLKCGEWQNTALAPTFSYQIVTIGEDFTIQYDQNWPGINNVACPACK